MTRIQRGGIGGAGGKAMMILSLIFFSSGRNRLAGNLLNGVALNTLGTFANVAGLSVVTCLIHIAALILIMLAYILIFTREGQS